MKKPKEPDTPYVPRKTSWLIKVGEKYYKRMEAQPPFDFTGKIEIHRKDLVKLKKIIND